MLLLNQNNGNSKSQMSLQSQIWYGHNFLSSSLICQLFTNPILRKNIQFKCKCNLHRGADSSFAVSIANNHLQRANQPKQRPAAVSLRLSQSPSLLCSWSHLPQSLSSPKRVTTATAGISSWIHPSSREAGWAWGSVSKACCHHLWKPELKNSSQQLSTISYSGAGMMLALNQGKEA